MFGYFADVPDYEFNLTTAANLLKSVPLPTVAASATFELISEFVAKD